MSCEHTSRCSGHCCRRFYLPYTPEELQQMADGSKFHTHNPDEIQKVAGMVIPLKPAVEYEFLVDGVTPVPPNTKGYYYTCKHHDEATGNCLNYVDRPNMCSAFPFYKDPTKRCEYKDCTWEDARNPVIPAQRSQLTRKIPRQYDAADIVVCKAKADDGADCSGTPELPPDNCTKEKVDVAAAE